MIQYHHQINYKVGKSFRSSPVFFKIVRLRSSKVINFLCHKFPLSLQHRLEGHNRFLSKRHAPNIFPTRIFSIIQRSSLFLGLDSMSSENHVWEIEGFNPSTEIEFHTDIVSRGLCVSCAMYMSCKFSFCISCALLLRSC